MKCHKCKHEIPDDSLFCPDCGCKIGDRGERIKQLMKEAKQAYDAGDYGRSLTAYQEAANLGHAEAQYMLAVQYDNGQGTLKDRPKAHYWLLQAAQNGYVPAQFLVGEHYYYGECVKQDKQEAAKWYQKAANAKHPDATFKLGLCYKNGKGVEHDDVLAQQYFSQAEELGSEMYADYLKEQEEERKRKEEEELKRQERLAEDEISSKTAGCLVWPAVLCGLFATILFLLESHTLKDYLMSFFYGAGGFGFGLFFIMYILSLPFQEHKMKKWRKEHYPENPVCKY